MTLKPQDVLVVLKLFVLGRCPWSYAGLAVALGMSPSQLHAAVKRALAAQLLLRSGDQIVVNVRNVEEFLIHGLRYVFVPERGEITRGIPTGADAAPLKGRFAKTGEPPWVWPYAEGHVRGLAFSPIYHLAPQAALSDESLYEALVLADAIRGGRAREREIAIKELKERLNAYS